MDGGDLPWGLLPHNGVWQLRRCTEVHNGMAYGIMAAYAEGFAILRSADTGSAVACGLICEP